MQLADVSDAEQRSSLKELKRLSETLGFEIVGEVTQNRKSLGATTVLARASWWSWPRGPAARASLG